jgi:hypothetical protein
MPHTTPTPADSVGVNTSVQYYGNGSEVTLKITNNEGWHRTARTDSARVISSLEEVLPSLSGTIQEAASEYARGEYEEDGETMVPDPPSTTLSTFDRLDSIDLLRAVRGLVID